MRLQDLILSYSKWNKVVGYFLNLFIKIDRRVHKELCVQFPVELLDVGVIGNPSDLIIINYRLKYNLRFFRGDIIVDAF